MAQALRSTKRTTSPSSAIPKRRPALTVVPRRRRLPAVIGGVAFAIVIVGMLAVAVLHTQLAERQFQIDRLERSVAEERARFDEIRNERAQLRSPQRVADVAWTLGMRPGQTGQFVDVDPWALARQIAAAGVIHEAESVVRDADPLAQFRDVKAVSVVQP